MSPNESFPSPSASNARTVTPARSAGASPETWSASSAASRSPAGGELDSAGGELGSSEILIKRRLAFDTSCGEVNTPAAAGAHDRKKSGGRSPAASETLASMAKTPPGVGTKGVSDVSEDAVFSSNWWSSSCCSKDSSFCTNDSSSSSSASSSTPRTLSPARRCQLADEEGDRAFTCPSSSTKLYSSSASGSASPPASGANSSSNSSPNSSPSSSESYLDPESDMEGGRPHRGPPLSPAVVLPQLTSKWRTARKSSPKDADAKRPYRWEIFHRRTCKTASEDRGDFM